MITHDVDEAILLADRILLMTNGPRAKVAESVKINIARPRNRSSIIDDANYYKIRNHLVNFLVTRSGELSQSDENISSEPKEVDPAGEDPAGENIAEEGNLSEHNSTQERLHEEKSSASLGTVKTAV